MRALNFLLITLATILSGQFAIACIGEAQIIARVARTENTMSSCRVFVDDVRFYQVNQICPLELSEVIDNGIEVELVSGLYCSLKDGAEISGILVKSPLNIINIE